MFRQRTPNVSKDALQRIGVMIDQACKDEQENELNVSSASIQAELLLGWGKEIKMNLQADF